VLVHLTRAATSPTEIPLAALGSGVRGFTSVAGSEPTVRDARLVLPGDGPTALAAIVG
jgi:hypothetical protein